MILETIVEFLEIFDDSSAFGIECHFVKKKKEAKKKKKNQAPKPLA
jgi:hypothetical protein